MNKSKKLILSFFPVYIRKNRRWNKPIVKTVSFGLSCHRLLNEETQHHAMLCYQSTENENNSTHKRSYKPSYSQADVVPLCQGGP